MSESCSAAGHPGGDWAVFLDFDGTLVDIAPRPDAVHVDPALPGLLRRLHRRCGGALAIVTGRSIDVIDGFLPGLGLDTCGLHGMERRVGGRLVRIEPDNLPALRAAAPALKRQLASIPGVLIEDKGESLALHWRLAPEAAETVRAAARALADEVGPGFRLQDGKALIEIVPEAAGKGRAIEALLALDPYRDRRPLFAGDDVTDENGFVAIRAAGGMSIKIGAGPTQAERRIASPSAFRRWLEAFAAGDAPFDGLDIAR